MGSSDLVLRWEPLGGLSAEVVDQVHNAVLGGFEGAGFGRATAYAAAVVVEELCTNILEHSGAKWMELDLSSRQGNAHVVLKDDGCAFDAGAAILEQAQVFDLGSSVERRLGLHMVQQLASLLSSRRDDKGCNIIELEIRSDLDGLDPAPQEL